MAERNGGQASIRSVSGGAARLYRRATTEHRAQSAGGTEKLYVWRPCWIHWPVLLAAVGPTAKNPPRGGFFTWCCTCT